MDLCYFSHLILTRPVSLSLPIPQPLSFPFLLLAWSNGHRSFWTGHLPALHPFPVQVSQEGQERPDPPWDQLVLNALPHLLRPGKKKGQFPGPGDTQKASFLMATRPLGGW